VVQSSVADLKTIGEGKLRVMLNRRFYDPEIFTIAELFTRDECADLIKRAESIGFAAASVRTHDGPKMLTHIRNNERVNLDDETLAAEMWLRIEALCPEFDGQTAQGVDHKLRFYRYEAGQQFKRHKDGSVTNELGQASKLSYLVYLNDDFTGGETMFRHYEGKGEERRKLETVVSPSTGSALLFRHERWHEGTPVTDGLKYVLRTDVFYA